MNASEGKTLLRRARLSRGRVFHYRLWISEDGRFCISVRCGGARESVHDVAPSLEIAERIFDRVTKGVVYPCHLKEVVEDLILEIE